MMMMMMMMMMMVMPRCPVHQHDGRHRARPVGPQGPSHCTRHHRRGRHLLALHASVHAMPTKGRRRAGTTVGRIAVLISLTQVQHTIQSHKLHIHKHVELPAQTRFYLPINANSFPLRCGIVLGNSSYDSGSPLVSRRSRLKSAVSTTSSSRSSTAVNASTASRLRKAMSVSGTDIGWCIGRGASRR